MNEAELLFSEILNCDRLSLYLKKDTSLAADKSILISSVLKRRIYGEPIQYILGKTEFMGLEFRLNHDVFIPRPETEILVETVMKAGFTVHGLKILEIGTGSGCIAVSLAKLLKEADITATDISEDALAIAKGNAERHRVKINFILADLFDGIGFKLLTADLIISNPPYIPSAEIMLLQPEIEYEPHIALDGGEDGLNFYRRIIKTSADYLKDDGFLVMEIGCGQRQAVEDIFQKQGGYKITDIVKDYNKIDRVVVAKKKWIS